MQPALHVTEIASNTPHLDLLCALTLGYDIDLDEQKL